MIFLHEYDKKILSFISRNKSATIQDIEKNLGIEPSAVSSVIERLASQDAIEVSKQEEYAIKITDEGKEYLNSGFPEEVLIKEIKHIGGNRDLSLIIGNIAVSWAKKNRWIEIKDGKARLTKEGEKISNSFEYKPRELLKTIAESPKQGYATIVKERRDEIDVLVKRNIIEIKQHNVVKEISITKKGIALLSSEEKGIGQLTRDAITSEKWRKEGFRQYNISAETEKIYPARMHPLHEFLNYIRDIWVGMGFTEVSGPIVESAFWSFDALFSPQDHPTRDMQDTFFLSNPRTIDIDDVALLNRVKEKHEKGWGDTWKEEIAKQSVLRTHTTSVTAHYMKKFGNAAKGDYPIKLFSIGRAFRNESIDYKHLAEFYQTDGIVIGDNLTLANLMYIMKSFYKNLGIKAEFMPSYFPFVEPGLQVYYYDEKKKDTIELNGAGIIRKEITDAMGTNKTILAWGIGLERPMFNFMKMDSIVELYKNDIGWLRNREELKL